MIIFKFIKDLFLNVNLTFKEILNQNWIFYLFYIANQLFPNSTWFKQNPSILSKDKKTPLSQSCNLHQISFYCQK